MELNSTTGVYHSSGHMDKEVTDSAVINADVEMGYKNRQPNLIGATNMDSAILKEPEISGEYIFVLTSAVRFTG